jgi:ATP-dependent Clp protease ATP-binding subunit ClpA
MLNELNIRLLEQRIKINFTKAVKEAILNAAFDPEYGADQSSVISNIISNR